MKWKSYLYLFVALLLLVSGGALLPRAEEPRGLALVNVIALAQTEEQGIFVATLAKTEEDGVALRQDGWGDTLPDALQNAKNQAKQSLNLAHVEHIVLEASFAQDHLQDFFSFCLQNKAQSLDATLWVLQDAPLGDALTEEVALLSHLNLLHSQGKRGDSPKPLTLLEGARCFAKAGAVCIPSLTLQADSIDFVGYVRVEDGSLTRLAENKIDFALLQGRPLKFCERLDTPKGAVVVALTANKVLPRLQDGQVFLETEWTAEVVQGDAQMPRNIQVCLEQRLQARLGGVLERYLLDETDPLGLWERARYRGMFPRLFKQTERVSVEIELQAGGKLA